MSIAILNTCWKHSMARGTDLLVLLALADIANDDGECWPSIPHLAKKCRLDTRTTQRRIRSLEQLGEVVVVVCGGKSSKAGGVRSNHYRIVVYIPADEDSDGGDSPPRQSATGGTHATQTLAPVPPMTLAPVPPESSIGTVKESSSRVDEALAVIVDRRVTTTKTMKALANERGYRRAVLDDVRAQHEARARALIDEDPTIDARALADRLEPEVADLVGSDDEWDTTVIASGDTFAKRSESWALHLQAQWRSDHPDEPGVRPIATFLPGGALAAVAS